MIDERTLRRFCGGWYDAPWTTDGMTFATDNRIVILGSVTELGEFPPYKACGIKEPNIRAIIPENAKYVPLGEPDEVKDQRLKLECECAVKCSACRGRGEHKCDCGDSHDCYKCNGSGSTYDPACEKCRGVGLREHVVRNGYLRFGRAWFDAKYISLVRDALGDVCEACIRGATDAAVFRRGEVTVLLMPVDGE